MSLVCRLGIGDHELIAIVGAGGKSTLMATLGSELAASGHSVVATTTTKMGSDQTLRYPTVVWDDGGGPPTMAGRPGPILFLARSDHRKVTGPPPETIDELFAVTDHVLVEADGARGKSFKAPDAHEPVIPQATTLVVVVMGADAFDRTIAEAAHRPGRVEYLTGSDRSSRITPALAAAVLGHPEGGLRNAPAHARVVVGVTKVDDAARRAAADQLARHLETHPRIEHVVVIGPAWRSDAT
jgi:probable selenium-dependent hydroxylase accessory protein YqeC